MTSSDPHFRPIARALISVSDKTGLTEFARALAAHNIDLISTGGTAEHLRKAGLECRDVSDLTGFPEIMDGRLKTLHPLVAGGLLARRDKDMEAVEAHNIAPIDLLVVNLYPFEKSPTPDNIDIGGPTMLRAAAKNHADVAVITDIADYPRLLEALKRDGGTDLALRQSLAQKAFARTAVYDAAISNRLADDYKIATPDYRAVGGRLHHPLRYGENPHQTAGFYTHSPDTGIAAARQLQGKELSYNNINDADAACALLAAFAPDDRAGCVIVKHANPCGVALADTPANAFSKALACDPTSAFGGIVALNRPLDAATARGITEIFTEIVLAPDADDDARKIFAAQKNLRLLMTDNAHQGDSLCVRGVSGGLLVQRRDDTPDDATAWQCVTKRAPTETEHADLAFAWRVVAHVKSNAIVVAKDTATLGIGAGQPNRLNSARLAVAQAGDNAKGAVAASDAFFPFADGLDSLAESGVSAIIQPGGSIRDKEVIEAADKANLAMLFTGKRHFRH